ncbi:carbohydrate ABC transporter permease [Vibrio sp. SCSIO 43132]|uniref:carbohydrate ABC transporter permease n=1 Tax=Vibrio sp. SCSIO 43132 TaxID=2779363 RepID=UPI001CA9859D|nr:carbohydrate ABC transporter permease [Vibrio sp. SCSIO 43132]UAB71028.1 carbohydrate ABC transporter permease [Vibrio sp. SCSIO 43132]
MKLRFSISKTIMYTFLSFMAFISIFPFYWLIVSATNTTNDINKGKLTFGDQILINFTKLNEHGDLLLVFWNTGKIAILTAGFTLLICSMAGYGFEVYRNKSRDKAYSLLLLTMMIPFAALMIPLFTMTAKFNMLDTHLAVILPGLSAVFIIFYFRQCTKAFPRELIDAARVDGVKDWKIFLYIYMPVMKNTYAAAFIIVFMGSWNNFLWPLIVLQSPEKKVINLLLSSLGSAYFPDFGVIMLGTLIATIPTLLVFFVMQKQFVAGMTGSVK